VKTVPPKPEEAIITVRLLTTDFVSCAGLINMPICVSKISRNGSKIYKNEKQQENPHSVEYLYADEQLYLK